MTTWLVIAAGSALAAFVQGMAGFGFGLVSLAVWSWTIDPALAVPMVVFGSLVGQLLAVGSLRQGFRWHRLLPFLVGGTVGVPIGMVLFHLMDPVVFKFGVGLLLAAYCTSVLCLPRLPRITRGGRIADGAVGWVGGVMSGFGGLPGPAPTLWCALRGWPKDEQRTAFQAFNLFMHGLTLAAYLAYGLITPDMAGPFAVVAVAVLLPTFAGIHLYRRFSDSTFKRLLLALLALSGFMLLLSTAPTIWQMASGSS